MCPAPPRLRPYVDRYLLTRLAREMPPRVWQVARRLKVSEKTLGIRFQEEVGVTLERYFIERQIACAKDLLDTTDLPNATIAARSGFASERSFYRSFKRETGMTPGEYRTRLKPLI
jgi:AraC-like DNA-binding protein